MQAARLILDPPATGVWNMAVDEALLHTATPGTPVTLRIYRWRSPTLSLGYFQRYEDRHGHAASQNCPLVRRVTGGGAIVHDREITYSVTAPVAGRVQQPPLQWYELTHSAWVATLAKYGVRAALCPTEERGRDAEFLCFRRRAAGDLLLDGWKIGGSAQRRHRTALLQHGSLLMERSAAAPELPGIAQLARIEMAATAWLDDWILEIGRGLRVTWKPDTLTDHERDAAARFVRDRFENPKWTLRR